MQERFQLPIPFWRMQYQLLGGHRKIWFLALIYAIVVVVGAIAFQRYMHKEPLSVVCAWIVNGLLAIQAFLMLVGGSNAIHKSLLRDYQTKMSESHRLTPMSNLSVVLGYVIGANLQVLLLFGITIGLGLIAAGIGGALMGAWFIGNILLLCAALSLWSAVTFVGMRPAKPIGPGWMIGGIAGFGMPIAMIPGTGLMLGIYTTVLAVWIVIGRIPATEPIAYLVAAVSLVITTFWLSAAATKYRRPDLPALNGARALVLLVLWLVLATGGMVVFQMVSKSRPNLVSLDDSVSVQWIGTVLCTLVLCAVATLGATDCRMLVESGRQPRGWGDRLSDRWVTFLAAALACGFLAAFGQRVWLKIVPSIDRQQSDALIRSIETWGATVAAFMLSGFIARAWFRITKLRFKPKSPLVITWTLLIVFWALPIVDTIRAAATATAYGPLKYTWLSGISPPGTIAIVWTNLPVPIWGGVAVQVGLLIVLTLLGLNRTDRIVPVAAPVSA